MNQNPHKIPKDANLKDFINMERYFMGKPSIFNKYYQTNLLQIIDKLPDLNQEERQKYAMQNNVNLMRKKKVIRKQLDEQNNFEEILLKNVTLASKHQTDRLNQDLQINQYSFTGLLGRGAHSVVRLCKSSKQQNQIYACKILWFDKIRKKYFIRQKQLIDMVNNEIVLLNQLRHPHIIKAKEAIYLKQKQRLFLILEYCSKGPINKLINNSLTIEDKEWWQIVRKYFCQFVSAMKFMHQNNIIHRDIKPENLLIDQNDQLKIIDFNVSQRLNKGESKIKITNKFIGTKGYAAPQLILDLEKEKLCDGQKIDVWAMAITLIELLERRHPYPVKTLPQLIKVLQNYKLQSMNAQNSSNQKKKGSQDNFSERLFINPEYPKELRNLLSKMLQFENQKRIGVQQIFQHPWIKNNK